jgi:hypothetical protein
LCSDAKGTPYAASNSFDAASDKVDELKDDTAIHRSQYPVFGRDELRLRGVVSDQ